MTTNARKPRTESSPTRASQSSSVLTQLGIIGMDPVEPVILGALIGGDPLLLIGPHGTGKSYLLNRISAGLGLERRHYNASLLIYDDLVGFPLPGKNGTLEYVQTPASIWGAEAVFIDEISRCRPDLQNKLFPIVHERRVQGILLDKLVYRWSAMNMPSTGNDDDDAGYCGSEPLDAALADRFAFIVPIPSWDGLSEAEQEEIILSTDVPVPEEAAHRLRFLTSSGRSLLPVLREELGAQLASYVRIVAGLLLQAGIAISPRRAGTLLRNILAVHSARLARCATAEPAESAWLAPSNSLPHLARCEGVNPGKVLAAHREAWKISGMGAGDPRRMVLLERDPLIRALRAAQVDSFVPADLSIIVADSLAAIPAGGRHALATEIFESGAAGRLVAAVAEQCAALYGLAAAPQDVQESVNARSQRHDVWTTVVSLLARLRSGKPDLKLGPDGKLMIVLEEAADAWSVTAFSASLQQAARGPAVERSTARCGRRCARSSRVPPQPSLGWTRRYRKEYRSRAPAISQSGGRRETTASAGHPENRKARIGILPRDGHTSVAGDGGKSTS